MNKLVSEVKVYTANEIGANIEDMLESAKNAEKMHEGARLILGEAAKKVGLLVENVKQDINEGKIKLEELDTIEKVEGIIRRYIARAQNVLENMQLSEQSSQVASAGMVTAYTRSMNTVKRMCDIERGKLAAYENDDKKKPETNEEPRQASKHPRQRVVGKHPGNPLKDRKEA